MYRPLLHFVSLRLFDRSMPCLGCDLSHFAATALAALTRPKPHNKPPPSRLGGQSITLGTVQLALVQGCQAVCARL